MAMRGAPLRESAALRAALGSRGRDPSRAQGEDVRSASPESDSVSEKIAALLRASTRSLPFSWLHPKADPAQPMEG